MQINPFRQTAAEAGGQPDYMDALLKGFKGSQQAAETVMKPTNLAEALLKMQLENKMNKPKAEDAQGWYDLQKQGLQSENSMRGMQMEALRRKVQMQKENPFFGESGDLGKIGAMIYMQQHPDVFPDIGGNQQMMSEQLPVSEQDMSGMNFAQEGGSFLPSMTSGATKQTTKAPMNYADMYQKAIMQSMMPKDSAYQGPAREARDLERLRNEVGENSPVYKQAQELARQKSETNSALNEQRLRRAGGLKPGETEVKNDSGEVIGISKDFSPTEAKEEKGRIFFNYTYPKILQATSYYSGQGSIVRFANDASKYKTDKKSQQRIDNYLAAVKSIGPGAVKENATVGGANTNQVYNRLISTLNSSDLPKKVPEIVRKYGLPKEAELRAGLKFQSWLNQATNASKKIPARHTQYLDGDKKGHIYNSETKSLDEVIVSPDHWDEFRKAGGY